MSGLVEVEPSPLGDYLYRRCIQSEPVPETAGHRAGTYALGGAAVATGYVASNVFIKTALNSPETLGLSQTVAVISAVGCLVGFGSFFAEGQLDIVERSRTPEGVEESVLRRNARSRISLVAMCVFAAAFGIFAQFGLIDACKDNYTHYAVAIGIFSMLFSAGPLILAMFDGTKAVGRRGAAVQINRCGGDERRRTLLEFKEKMVANLSHNIEVAQSLPEEERRLRISSFYPRGRLEINNDRVGQLNLFLSDVFQKKPFEGTPLKEKHVTLIGTEYFITAWVSFFALAFLWEQGEISFGSAGLFTSSAWLAGTLAFISLLPWVWKAMTVPRAAAIGLANQLLSVVGLGHRRTFVEKHHPYLSKALDACALGATSLTYAQIATLAEECCFDPDRLRGQLAIYGSLQTIMLIFFFSLKRLLERGVVSMDRRCGDRELTELILFNEKAERLLQVLQDVDPEDIGRLLSECGMTDDQMRQLLD